jgi:hypothetical protein
VSAEKLALHLQEANFEDPRAARLRDLLDKELLARYATDAEPTLPAAARCAVSVPAEDFVPNVLVVTADRSCDWRQAGHSSNRRQTAGSRGPVPEVWLQTSSGLSALQHPDTVIRLLREKAVGLSPSNVEIRCQERHMGRSPEKRAARNLKPTRADHAGGHAKWWNRSTRSSPTRQRQRAAIGGGHGFCPRSVFGPAVEVLEHCTRQLLETVPLPVDALISLVCRRRHTSRGHERPGLAYRVPRKR